MNNKNIDQVAEGGWSPSSWQTLVVGLNELGDDPLTPECPNTGSSPVLISNCSGDSALGLHA